MAKGSQLNLFEQHVEKAVFGVCLLLLAYAVAHWVVSSPRTVELSGQEFGPDQVDKKLLETAKAVQDAMDKARPPAGAAVVHPYSTLMEQARGNPFPQDIRLADVGMPQPELKETRETKPVKLAVPDIIPIISAPAKPKVWASLELPNVGEKPADMVVAHIAVEYPLDKLRRALDEKLRRTTLNVSTVFLRVEAEVQEKQADGAWGPVREVKGAFLPARDMAGKEVSPPEIPEFDGQNSKEVLAVVKTLEQYWQEPILEPDYWQIFYPTHTWGTWRIHLPKNSVSDMAPREGAPGTTPPGVTPPGITPPAITPPGTTPPGAGTPRPTVGPGYRGGSLPPEEVPSPGHTTPPRPSPTRTPTPTPTPPVVRPTVPARRPTTRPIATALPPVAAPESMPEPTPVPPMSQQIENGRILAWVHDMHLDNSRYYRYRVRFVLVNPLLASKETKTPNDARQIAISTPFSEWSDPVIVPTATRFFLTGGSSMLDKANVTVFTNCLGQPVRQSFPVSLGQTIGFKVDKDVINPTNGKRIKSPADFSTGAVVVDFDFTKTFRRGGITQTTTEMICMDENGKLNSRIQALDESSAAYKTLLDEVKRTEAAAAAAPPDTGGGT